jgi:hypothetical protein
LGGTIDGNINNSGSLIFNNVTLNGTLTNNGTLNVAGAATANGLVNNGSTGVMNFQSTTGSPSLTANAGLSNAGIINLTDPAAASGTSALSVNGTLTNTNTIYSIGSYGSRSMDSSTLNNTGSIKIEYFMSVNGVPYFAGSSIDGSVTSQSPIVLAALDNIVSITGQSDSSTGSSSGSNNGKSEINLTLLANDQSSATKAAASLPVCH